MSISTATFESIRKEIDNSRFAKENYTAVDAGWKYLRYRVYRPFLKMKYARFRKRNPKLPWLNPNAIWALQQLLKPDMTAFEYGSGMSTVFFSKLLKHIHSLEHNEAWYKRVKEIIEENKIDNTLLTLVPPDLSFEDPKLNSEDQLRMSVEEYPIPDRYFENYTAQITQMQDASLDLVIVDGRARVTCALNAIPKLKSGSILMLDNSERKRYRIIHKTLSNWPKIWTTSGLSDTTLWLKP